MKVKDYLKSFIYSIWFIRLTNFLCITLILLLIKNRFYMNDEYWYAIVLDRGIKTFHNFHILSNPVSNITWLFVTLFGLKISAFRILQISNSVVAAMGATALIDLGMFWGLKRPRAILFSAPIILCNGFIRYATSAYPGALAMGVGLIGLNLLVRGVESFISNNGKPKLLFVSGMVLGLAGLMHLAFVGVIPALLFAIVLVLSRNKINLSSRVRVSLFCLAGFLLVIGFAYVIFLPLCTKFFPGQVEYFKISDSGLSQSLLFTILSGNNVKWLPNLSNLFISFKTLGALFISGVHSNNIILDKIFDLPRVFSFILLAYFTIKVILNKEKYWKLSSWVFAFIISLVCELALILFSDFSQCRQYVVISLSVLGPMFVAGMIIAFGNKKSCFPVVIFLCIMIFHLISGVEGIIDITSHDNRPFMKLYSHCDVHIPKFATLPFVNRDNNLKQVSDCNWITAYGAFGPSVDFLSQDNDKLLRKNKP